MFRYTIYTRGKESSALYHLNEHLLLEVPGTGHTPVPGFFCTLLCVTLSQNNFQIVS